MSRRQVRKLEGASFGCIPATNLFRRFLFTLVEHPLYESLVLAVIITNCVLLAMDDSTVPPASTLRLVIDNSDYVFAGFFAVEMLMKLLAWGVWNCGHRCVQPEALPARACCWRGQHPQWICSAPPVLDAPCGSCPMVLSPPPSLPFPPPSLAVRTSETAGIVWTPSSSLRPSSVSCCQTCRCCGRSERCDHCGCSSAPSACRCGLTRGACVDVLKVRARLPGPRG